jgi:hypothetical protein
VWGEVVVREGLAFWSGGPHKASKVTLDRDHIVWHHPGAVMAEMGGWKEFVSFSGMRVRFQ